MNIFNRPKTPGPLGSGNPAQDPVARLQEKLAGQQPAAIPGAVVPSREVEVPSADTFAREVPEISGREVPVAQQPTDFEGNPISQVENVQLSPAQQSEDISAQGDRFATPSSLPDFTDEATVSQQLQQADRELNLADRVRATDKERIASKLAKPGDEAGKIMAFANHQYGRIQSGEGIWGNEKIANAVVNDLGLSREDRTDGHIKAALSMGFAKSLTDIDQFQLAGKKQLDLESNQGGSEDITEEMLDAGGGWGTGDYSGTNRRFKEGGKKDFKYIDNLSQEHLNTLDKQPILRGWLNGLGSNVANVLDEGNLSGSLSPNRREVSTLTNYGLAKDMLDQGLVEFGIDRDGMVYPMITEEGKNFAKAVELYQIAHDPEARLKNAGQGLKLAQRNRLVKGTYAGKQAAVGASGVIKEGAIGVAATAIELMNAVPLTMDGGLVAIQQGMLADMAAQGQYFTEDGAPVPANPANAQNPKLILGYSNSPYADALVKASANSFNKIKREKLSELKSSGKPLMSDAELNMHAAKIISQQINQAGIQVQQSADLVGDGVRYPGIKQSLPTGRFFEQSEDFDHIGRAGTTRMSQTFAHKEYHFVKPGLTALLSDTVTSGQRNLTSDKRGVEFGMDIEKKLKGMDRKDLAMLDALYQVSAIMVKLDKATAQSVNPNLPIHKWSPVDYLRMVQGPAGEQRLRNFARAGERVAMWKQGQLPTEAEFEPLGLGSVKDFFERKEWKYTLDNIEMAHQIVKAADGKGGNVKLGGMIETDGRQSNAFIMSLVIGDLDIGALLGVEAGLDSYTDHQKYRDLRNRASSTIAEDVKATLNGDKDSERATAISDFLLNEQTTKGEAFSKLYARGLVVAGLYGKAPQFMFSEVRDMLSQMDGTKWDALVDEHYNGDEQAAVADLAKVYSTSMKKHMSSLMGYQTMFKKLAEMKAALNGTSQIKTFGGMMADIGETYARMKSSIDDMGIESTEVDTGEGPIQLPEWETVSDLRGRNEGGKGYTEQRIAELRAKGIYIDGTAGEKARNAAPVNPIQSGDTFQLASSLISATQDNPKLGNNALNFRGIHDALITAPGSTLLMLNAFNNIAPHLLAKNGKPMIQGIVDSLAEDNQRAVKDVEAAGYANIGDRGKYSALSGFFDRVYINTYARESHDAKMGRKEEPWMAESKERNMRVLKLATEMGWMPPTFEHKAHRESGIAIKPDKFEGLVTLMREAQGLLQAGQSGRFLTKAEDAKKNTKVSREIDAATGYKNGAGRHVEGANDKINRMMTNQKGWNTNALGA